MMRYCRNLMQPRIVTSSLKHRQRTLHTPEWKCLRPISSKVDKASRDHAQKLNPEAYQFLTETLLENKKKTKNQAQILTLWNQVNSYLAGSYKEKCILLDPGVAKSIADIIEEKSEKGKESRFVDADGGFFMVTENLIRRNVFPEAHAYVKDPFLDPIGNFLMNDRWKRLQIREKIHIKNINLVKTIVKELMLKEDFISPLNEEVSTTKDWKNSEPPYTFFGTTPHHFIKYLAFRCFNRSRTFSEFHRGRPEFFLLISEKTWKHITIATSKAYPPANILINVAFDYELLSTFPRSSFFPWRYGWKCENNEGTNMLKGVSRDEASFHLIRVRPKIDNGLREDISPDHFIFFIYSLYRHSSNRVIPFLEKFIPGVGFQFVRKGFNIYKVARDVGPEEIVGIFNEFASHPNYCHSNFHSQVKVFMEDKEQRKGGKNQDVQLVLENMRRKYRIDE